MNIEIYVGGSCDQDSTRKNHTGGWCSLIIAGDIVIDKTDISGNSINTTTYRMKLTAALEGLIFAISKYGDGEDVNITIYSDNIYLVNAFNDGWVDGWIERGRHRGILMKSGHDKKTGSKVVANSDLWWVLIYLVKKFNVKFKFVSPHSCENITDVHNKATDEMRVARAVMSTHIFEPTELKVGKEKKLKALKEGRLSYITLHERKLKK